jgi:hypothetical protein
MAGLSESRQWDSLLTTTLANYREKMYDNIFDDYPFLSYLNGKLGKAMRGNSVKRLLSGGESIVEHLLYEQNSTVKSYSGAEQLDVTLQEGHTIARFLWKQYAVSIGITGLEKRSNMGEAAMINLLSAKATQAEMSLRDRMSVDAFADGTGNAGKNLTGLSALVSTTATVGGLAPGTHTWWVADVSTSTGSFSSGGLDAMRSKANDITFGNDKPDSIFTTQAIHEYYEKSLQPQERFSSNTVADAGFMNITFRNIPVIFDRDCTSGVMYFLNSRYLNLCCHRDADISTGPFVTPENQDVSTAMVLFQGNLTTNNRRKLGSLTGITA